MIKAQKSTNITFEIDSRSESRPYKNYYCIYNGIDNKFVVKNDTISSRKHQY